MLEPEVAGEMGENTVYDNFNDVRYKGDYPKISYLHFIFLGWLGDDIIESTPCFIVTDKLANKIEKGGLSGYKFEEIEVSLSDDFIEMYPNRYIPKFKRLIPIGRIVVDDAEYTEWSGEDFNLSNKSYLVVSEKVLNILKTCNIENCDIYELSERVD